MAVWRAAHTSANAFRDALISEWVSLAFEHEGLRELTVNFALDDQGPYTHPPDEDGLVPNVDAFVTVGLESAHGLDDLPGRDELYRLSRRVDVWRVVATNRKAYDRNWPDGTEAPGVKFVSFMRRAEGLNHEQFVRHWGENHTPLALRHHVGLWNYTQNVVRRAYTPGGRDIDGIAELHFATRDDFDHRFFDSDEGRQAILADVKQFMGRFSSASALMTELPLRTAGS